MWSRGLVSIRGGHLVSKCRFSVANSSEGAGIDDFLHNICSTPPQASTKNQKVLETSAEFGRWLDQNPVRSIDKFIAAAHMAITVKSAEQNKVFSKMGKIAKIELPKIYDSIETTEIVSTLRFLLQMSPKSDVCTDIQMLFKKRNISEAQLQAVPFETLVKIVRYADSSVDTIVLERIEKVLVSRIEKELANPADLLTILAGEGCDKSMWFHQTAFIEKAQKLVTVMGTADKCALLERIAAYKQRNIQLLGAIINSISYSSQCLDVSQIVNITNSCCTLSYYPEKIAKKISDDLEKNSNVLRKWDSVISIADSFVRMRMGNQKSWNLLVRWAIENENQANTHQLSRFVSDLARIGVSSGTSLAKQLKPHLKREHIGSPAVWLNIVYSLAYFQELDEAHADSVLNKSFVKQIMESAHEKHDRLRKAMMLLMISSATKVDMAGNYRGPTVTRDTFVQYGIKFDAETIRNARQLKYSRNNDECDNIFLNTLFKIAPKDTHCGLPNVENCGAFVDAYVMPDANSGLVLNKNQWGSNRPKPLFFYGWHQTKQHVQADGEEMCLGQDQLGLRLMRAEGYDPVVIFKTEFDYCSTDIDKVNMLKKKIHNTN